MKRKSHAGITSVAVPIWVQDTSSTTGAGLSGLTSGTSGLVAEYRRQGANSWTAITLAAGTLGTWSSGGFIADGSLAGAYEVGIPNAAVASGARWVAIRLYGAVNMLPVLIEIELDAVDYQDATAFGLANLDIAVSTRSSYAGGDTAGTTTLLSRLTSGRATNLDALDAAVSSRLAPTVGGRTLDVSAGGEAGIDWANVGSPTTTVNLSGTTVGTITTYTGDTPQTGDSFARIGATGSGLTSLAPAATALSTANWTTARAGKLDFLDIAISTRSTYAGADTAGTSTLLTRIPSALTITGGGVTVAAYASGQDPAALVLDVTASSHNLTGSVGAKINAAGAAGDPWTTALPGSYAAGTAGQLLGNGLTLTALLTTPRALDAIPDNQLTVADALWCALSECAGRENKTGTSYVKMTPSTGTVLRTFLLDNDKSPSIRT